MFGRLSRAVSIKVGQCINFERCSVFLILSLHCPHKDVAFVCFNVDWFRVRLFDVTFRQLVIEDKSVRKAGKLCLFVCLFLEQQQQQQQQLQLNRDGEFGSLWKEKKSVYLIIIGLLG